VTWSWVNDHTAILALVVAATAAGLSLANTLLNRRYRRQDAYLRMHDLLTTPDMSRGRRLVYAIGRGKAIPEYGTEDYDAVNRVLNAHNNLATYVRRGVIAKPWALDAWHHTLRDLAPGAKAFIDHRAQQHSWRLWTDLEQLISDAAGYNSRRPCCRTDAAPTSAPPADEVVIAGDHVGTTRSE
jgi:hypothetical protein